MLENEHYWLAAARAGERPAYDRLCQAYRHEICAFCNRFLRHQEDAEDAAQDVFSKAWERLGTFRSDSTFRTWLWEIARNVCLNRLRARQSSLNRRLQSLEAAPESGRPETMDVPDSKATPEEVAVEAAQFSQIKSEIHRLALERKWESTDWELFALRIEDQLPYADFASLRGRDEAYWRNRWRDKIKPVLLLVRIAIQPAD